MISDRLEGVWERSAVAGVKPKEMLNVHITLQSTIIMFQVASLFQHRFYCNEIVVTAYNLLSYLIINIIFVYAKLRVWRWGIKKKTQLLDFGFYHVAIQRFKLNKNK